MARDGESRRRERNVRVFTVNSESRYVLVRNIPALGVIDDLLKRLSLYGKVCEYRILDHADDLSDENGDDGDEDAERRRDDRDRFTDTVWVQYEAANNARHAKVRAVQKPFFGSMLHIAYAPQFESREDTMLKLTQRRVLLQRRARMPMPAHQHYNDLSRAQQYYQPSVQTMQVSAQPQKPAVASSNDEFIGPQLPARGWRPPVESKKTVAPLQDPKRRRI